MKLELATSGIYAKNNVVLEDADTATYAADVPTRSIVRDVAHAFVLFWKLLSMIS